MRIAQVSPLIEPVPPSAYGGTERVVSILTEGLVNDGHEVTLFASADSVTAANLVSTSELSLRSMGKDVDIIAYGILQLQDVIERSGEFDIIHFHNDYIHFPVSRIMRTKQVTTLHGRLDINGLDKLYQRFTDMPVVSISNNQRLALPFANYIATVYHGIPTEKYSLVEDPRNYLAFLGRISPEKGVEDAIKIAEKAGIPLKIAAKIDVMDIPYFERVKELLQHEHVEFIGEIGDNEKQEFLGNAVALLFPINWPEPFGLVMIEAMACGTPVIAYNRGSVPEVIANGVSGYIVENVEEAVRAIDALPLISRSYCRSEFQKRFSAQRMINEYTDIYRELAGPEIRTETAKRPLFI